MAADDAGSMPMRVDSAGPRASAPLLYFIGERSPPQDNPLGPDRTARSRRRPITTRSRLRRSAHADRRSPAAQSPRGGRELAAAEEGVRHRRGECSPSSASSFLPGVKNSAPRPRGSDRLDRPIEWYFSLLRAAA